MTLNSSLCFCLPGLISLPLLSSYTLCFLFSFPRGLFFSSSHCKCFFSGLSLSQTIPRLSFHKENGRWRHLGWRGALAARESWGPGELQVSKEEDGERGRQGGTLTGIQTGTRRRKKISRKEWGGRWEAREECTQE